MTNISLTLEQQDALALLRAATNISNARVLGDKAALAKALDENMQLWTGIQTLLKRGGHPLPNEIKSNLLKLANFVVSKTLLNGCDAKEATLDTLENMNLQIAEGLLEAA